MEMETSKTVPAEEELTVEEALERLNGLLEELEREDITLENAFRNYEQGMKLVKFCSDSIDRVEKKVQIMQEDGTLKDFA